MGDAELLRQLLGLTLARRASEETRRSPSLARRASVGGRQSTKKISPGGPWRASTGLSSPLGISVTKDAPTCQRTAVFFALGDVFRRDVVSAKVGIGEVCRITLAIFAGYSDSFG
jgi:hypothetical protein